MSEEANKFENETFEEEKYDQLYYALKHRRIFQKTEDKIKEVINVLDETIRLYERVLEIPRDEAVIMATKHFLRGLVILLANKFGVENISQAIVEFYQDLKEIEDADAIAYTIREELEDIKKTKLDH